MMERILPKLLEFMAPNSAATSVMASRSLQILTTLTSLISEQRESTGAIDAHLESVLTVFSGCIKRNVLDDEEWLVKV